MASIREKVLKTLNSELGTDLKNLSKCEGLAKKFLDEKESIEQKVKVCSITDRFSMNVIWNRYLHDLQ